VPSNFSSCICFIGAKPSALVEIVFPGNIIGGFWSRILRMDGTKLRIAAAWSPKTLGDQLRAFDERAQLQPRSFRMTRVKADEGSKAAIGASDDALSADDIGESLEPLRDQLGMLDTVGLGVRDRTRLAS
jgi:hypothetical protein